MGGVLEILYLWFWVDESDVWNGWDVRIVVYDGEVGGFCVSWLFVVVVLVVG